MNDTDVRMRKGRSGLGLDEEPLLELGGISQMRGKELKGDIAFELDILGPVDNAHSAPPDFRNDPEFSGDNASCLQNMQVGLKGQRRGRSPLPSLSQRRGAGAAETRVFDVLGVALWTFHGTLTFFCCPDFIIAGAARQPRTQAVSPARTEPKINQEYQPGEDLEMAFPEAGPR
jgi:hypothetical protein